MVMATVVEKEMQPIPSVKDLASSDPSLRRKNLQTVISHLESRPATNHLTHTQALQLWRAFHVSLYMHDSKNQLSVQTLIATLADTFRIIRTKDIKLSPPASSTQESIPKSKTTNGSKPTTDDDDEFSGFDDEPRATTPATSNLNDSWLSTYGTSFWETISREWSTIDQWRMNKYLLLIRLVVREIFTICLETRLGIEQATVNTDIEAEAEAEREPETKPDTTKSKKRKANKDEQRSEGKRSKVSTVNNAKHTSSHSSTPKRHQADASITSSQMGILTLFPLSPRNRAVTDGLRLHVLDIYVDELFRCVADIRTRTDTDTKTDIDNEELKRILANEFMVPVRGIAAEGLSRNVRLRAKGVIAEFEKRVGEDLV